MIEIVGAILIAFILIATIDVWLPLVLKLTIVAACVVAVLFLLLLVSAT